MIVTGASGLLGANLCLVAADRGLDVTAVSSRTPFRADGVVTAQLDLRDAAAVREVVERARPRVVVHCAAMTDVDACESEPERAFAVNAQATATLAEAAAGVGARLVAVSTDAVFDGQTGGYTEIDPVSPVNVYAQSKLAGERAALEASPTHLVVRTTLFGWNAQPKRSLAEWALARLDAGDRVPGFTDAVFAPLEASTLGEVLLDLVETGASGVVHVGSRDAVSKFDFARAVAETFGHDPDRVDPTLMTDVPFRAPRPPRTALDASRAAGLLGRPLPTVQDGLARMRDLRADGWRERLRAARPVAFDLPQRPCPSSTSASAPSATTTPRTSSPTSRPTTTVAWTGPRRSSASQPRPALTRPSSRTSGPRRS